MSSARLAAGMLLVLALAVAPCALAQAPDPGQAPPKPLPAATLADTQVEWVASFSEALRLARETKRPILVAFNMDSEVATTRW